MRALRPLLSAPPLPPAAVRQISPQTMSSPLPGELPGALRGRAGLVQAGGGAEGRG